MAFFKKHSKRGSYDLFSTHSFCLPDVKGMLVLFGLFIVGTLLGSLCSGLFAALLGPSADMAAYIMLLTYPISFIPALLYASAVSRRNEMFEAGYALDNKNFGPKGGGFMALVVSLATIATAFVAEPLGLLLPDMPETLKRSMEVVTEGPLLANLISVSIFAPLFEEWLCRGLVLRGLAHKTSPGWAICISAAFFAILHMNPWQAIPAFILGLLFGYVYYKTGSLKLTMLMHCANNTFSVLLSRAPAFAEAETFMDVLSPWAYICIYISCILIIFSALVIFKAIPIKDKQMGGCEKLESFSTM